MRKTKDEARFAEIPAQQFRVDEHSVLWNPYLLAWRFPSQKWRPSAELSMKEFSWQERE